MIYIENREVAVSRETGEMIQTEDQTEEERVIGKATEGSLAASQPDRVLPKGMRIGLHSEEVLI